LVVVGARTALRLLPTLQKAEGKESLRDLVLPVFRATAVSWAACRYPAHETELAAAAEVSAGAARAAGPSAYFAYVAAYGATKSYGATDTAYTVDILNAAYPTYAAAMWSELSNDATRVEEGATASAIAGSRLWRLGQGAELLTLWQDMKEALLAAKPGLAGVDDLVRGPSRWPRPGREP
jgi:hypothetical protein